MKTGKRLWMGAITILSLLITDTACKKQNGGTQDTTPVVHPLPTPVGTSLGPALTRQIGTEGGTLTSADQQITITIPAGALSAATTIGIEPITNTNVAGMGTAYRLTPHGQHFNTPATITVSWAKHADTIGLLQTLGLAYQKDDGIWKFVGADSLDNNGQTVSFKTSHFSDWSLMNQVSLVPYQADIDPGAAQTVKAILFTSLNEDDILVPLPHLTPGTYDEPGYPVGNPEPLPSKFVKQWRLNGPGKITNITSTVVKYEAPASINDYTTATVSLELKAPPAYPGQYLLVSNINIIGSFIELSIGGDTPFTFPATPVVKSGNQYLLANPENEGGGYFLLTWTDGIGIHPFDLSASGTYLHFITPQTSYTSLFRENAQSGLVPSGGSVNVTRVSNGRAEGTFNATDAGYGPMLTDKTTLQGRFKVKLAQ